MGSSIGDCNFTGVLSANLAPTLPVHVARRQEIDTATAAPTVLGNVNRFAGGTPTDLDAPATANLVLGTRYQFTEAATGRRRVVRLVFSAAASAPPLITRPVDFDADANPRVYILEGPAADPTSDDLAEGETNLFFTDARAAAAIFPPAVTSVGDGASTSLEALPTTGLTVPTLRILAVGNELQNWLLVAGADATDADANGSPAHQRPNDFDAAANAKVWVRR